VTKTKPDDKEPEEEILVIEVYLRSRRFESKIQIPLHSPQEEKKKFIDRWLALMEAGLSMGSDTKVS